MTTCGIGTNSIVSLTKQLQLRWRPFPGPPACSRGCTRMPRPAGLMSSGHPFLTVWEAGGSEVRMPACPGLGSQAADDLGRERERERAPWGPFYNRTNPLPGGRTSGPAHLPKAPPPNTTVALGVPTDGLGVGGTNIPLAADAQPGSGRAHV